MARPSESSDAKKIEAALRESAEPLTIDEICKAALGRIGERERNLVRVNLHRLDERGVVQRYAARYGIKPKAG